MDCQKTTNLQNSPSATTTTTNETNSCPPTTDYRFLCCANYSIMGVAKKTRKFGQVSQYPASLQLQPSLHLSKVKRIIGQRDSRLAKNKDKGEIEQKKKTAEVVREVPQVSSSLFFQYNTALVPPYSVLVDSERIFHTTSTCY